jgi:hypothetical protein
VPVVITGQLPKPLDGMVREVLHRTLDPRPQEFVVHVSWPHSEMIVQISGALDKRLKFNSPAEAEVARELETVLSEIADGEFGPIEKPAN